MSYIATSCSSSLLYMHTLHWFATMFCEKRNFTVKPIPVTLQLWMSDEKYQTIFRLKRSIWLRLWVWAGAQIYSYVTYSAGYVHNWKKIKFLEPPWRNYSNKNSKILHNMLILTEIWLVRDIFTISSYKLGHAVDLLSTVIYHDM